MTEARLTSGGAISRFVPGRECPVCGGHERASRGHGKRCHGFVSSGGLYAHCSRTELAGSIRLNGKSETYAHKLSGACRCGSNHGGPEVADRGGVRSAQITASYDYCDASGNLLYQVVRKKPKAFLQRRPDGAGGWLWKLGDVEPTIYRLPAVLSAVAAGDPVYVVEGEKDADAIWSADHVATCNSGGVGKWKPEFSLFFRGARDVRIVADNDDPGIKHAHEVAQSIASVDATVTLLHSPVGKDVSDLLAAGYQLDDLVELDHDRDRSTPDGDTLTFSVGEFFNEFRLNVEKLGIAIRDVGHIELGNDGRLYRYLGGVHRGDGDSFARVRVREILGERYRRTYSDEVFSWLRAVEPSITDQPHPDVINVANGLLGWRTRVLTDHSPKALSTIQIPIRWNPEAKCPLIDTFLKKVIPKDAIMLVFEMIGYALYAGNPLRVAVLLLGPGRNGKSVLLSVIKTLLGPANVSAIPLQMLSENRFASAELFGKLANICGDLDARTIRQTDIFKMITGGDAITAERKYCPGFTFTPFALQIFSANEPPLSSDQTEAWFDRWLVIPMENRIPEDQVDPHLIAKLTTLSELEGLLVKAIGGLQRLMERGRFEYPESIKQAGSQYRERLDTVQGFVAEECALVSDAWTRRSDLYRFYRSWAKDGGRHPVSVVTFNDHLRRGFPGQVVERIRHGNWGWLGIGLLERREPP